MNNARKYRNQDLTPDSIEIDWGAFREGQGQIIARFEHKKLHWDRLHPERIIPSHMVVPALVYGGQDWARTDIWATNDVTEDPPVRLKDNHGNVAEVYPTPFNHQLYTNEAFELKGDDRLVTIQVSENGSKKTEYVLVTIRKARELAKLMPRGTFLHLCEYSSNGIRTMMIVPSLSNESLEIPKTFGPRGHAGKMPLCFKSIEVL